MSIDIDNLVAGIATKLANDGKLIEAGWVALRVQLPKDTPTAQLADMRLAYLAGAQHLFASMMGSLDAGAEPTAADLRRMDLIHAELERARGELAARFYPVRGRG